jgi:hypothetical protein
VGFLEAVGAAVGAAAVLGAATWLWRRRRSSWMPTARAEYIPSPVWTVALPHQLPAYNEADVQAMSLPDLRLWLGKHDAVDFDSTTLRLFIRGARTGQSIVRDVRFKIDERRPPFAGAWVHSPNAGANTAIVLTFDLNDPLGSAWEGHLDGALTRVGAQPYFQVHHVALGSDELVEFRVQASVSDAYVEWHLEVDIEARRQRRVVRVLAPDGQPFKTSHCGIERFGNTWLTGVGAMPGRRFCAMNPETGLRMRE